MFKNYNITHIRPWEYKLINDFNMIRRYGKRYLLVKTYKYQTIEIVGSTSDIIEIQNNPYLKKAVIDSCKNLKL